MRISGTMSWTFVTVEAVTRPNRPVRVRGHREQVEARFSKDERVGEIMAEGPPFDPSRIASGGFELLVEC